MRFPAGADLAQAQRLRDAADERSAMLDILSDGQMWFDDYHMGIGSFLWYWLERTKGVGLLSADDALALAQSGPMLRASGVDWDLRRDQQLPLAYDKVDWKVWTHPDGDSFARYWVRLQETREPAKMVDQLLDGTYMFPVLGATANDFSNDFTPSGSNWSMSVATGTPSAVSRANVACAPGTSLRMRDSTTPWSLNATSVAGGIVFVGEAPHER